MDKFPITPEGYLKLEKEIKYLKTVARPAIIKAIATARQFGDLSENAEYHSAREKQSLTESKLLDLEDKFSRSEVINYKQFTDKKIKFGATVKLVDNYSDEESIYNGVGEYEADISKKRISILSPIAKALIGKTIGDVVEVKTPKGNKSYEVLDVEYKEIHLE